MPSREQLGAAMRAAAQAGDHEAARLLAQAYQAAGEQSAPQSTGDIFREQLRAPLERAHPTRFPEHVEQAVREVVTEDIPQAASNALDVSGTQFRNIAQLRGQTLGAMGEPFGLGEFGRDVGSMGIDPATPEAQSRYRDAVIDMLLTTGGGAAGRSIGQSAGDAMKYLGRGFRTVPGAGRFVEQAAHYGAPVPTSLHHAREILKPTLSGAAVATAVDAMDPTPYELTDKPVAGGAGLVTAAGVAKGTIDDLLLGNPKWRGFMMRPTSGRAAALMGAILGHMAAKGIQATEKTIDNAVDEVARQLMGGEADAPDATPPGFYRPPPGRP